MSYVNSIIRQCPQLNLAFLLSPEETQINYTYDSPNDWIHTIDDEDDQDDVRYWVRRVKKGKITEDELREYVQNLLT